MQGRPNGCKKVEVVIKFVITLWRTVNNTNGFQLELCVMGAVVREEME